MNIKRPAVSGKIFVYLLVIALSSVITAVQCGSVGDSAGQPSSAAEQTSPLKSPDTLKSSEASAPREEDTQQHTEKGRPVDSSSKITAAADNSHAATLEGEPKVDNESSKQRKGRADTATPVASDSSNKQAEPTKAQDDKVAAPSTDKPAADSKASSKQADAKSSAAKAYQNSSKQTPLTGKSGVQKSKLPANLGTVTSTGSGGPTHYMSKHDAYSAIAEKHGALAQDAMRKADKRVHGVQGFGGIQKASGFGNALNPFKGVADGGLGRALGNSVRSIMKSKYSVPAYVASALLGAVALMAFYESPISPLPVPPLPEPPVGRFPPEMPNISPNVQVPFRTNQQQQQQQNYGQNYNSRSLNAMQSQTVNSYMMPAQQQPGQQVFFPSNSPQQRQHNQLLSAASLLSVGKQQNAQRKSGPDFDQASSRSFFGGANQVATPKLMAPVNPAGQSSSILSLFGFGGSGSETNSNSQQSQPQLGGLNSNQLSQASGLNVPIASGGSSEPKGSQSSAGGLSNSHLVNKVKSMFVRSSPTGSSSAAGIANAHNIYDQYQRMSFVQALMKDTAFLPGFLTTTRKSSPASAQPTNRIQSITNALTGSGTNPAARMQVGESEPIQPTSGGQHIQSGPKQQPKPASSGYGFVRAADRIAHALLETFTSGPSQRNALSSAGQTADGAARKSSSNDDMSSSPLASATSLLSDIVSSYSSDFVNSNLGAHEQHQAKSSSPPSPSSSSSSAAAASQNNQSQQQQQNSQAASQTGSEQANARSADSNEESSQEQKQSAGTTSGSTSSSSSSSISSSNSNSSSTSSSSRKSPTASASSSSSSSSNEPHVRKTRSIGLEYPIEGNQELSQVEQQPSRAAQINSVIDFVADSYAQNRLLFNFVMNQVGLSQAVPYVEQILASGPTNSRF